jgi:hypothetical protein
MHDERGPDCRNHGARRAIELAIAVHVRQGYRAGAYSSRVIGHRRLEGSVTVPQQDTHSVTRFLRHYQIGSTVAILISYSDRTGAGSARIVGND